MVLAVGSRSAHQDDGFGGTMDIAIGLGPKGNLERHVDLIKKER